MLTSVFKALDKKIKIEIYIKMYVFGTLEHQKVIFFNIQSY